MGSTTIRVGGYAPAGSAHSRALDHFAQALWREAGGGVEVDVLYNVMDQGRPASDLLDMVSTGELTWCYFSTSYLGPSVPALDALEIPFLFGSLADAHEALDGPFGVALSSATRAACGYEVLGYWDNGFRHLSNAHRPVRHPDDAAGLSIRVQPNPIHEALFAAWGMQPVPTELSRGMALIAAGEVDAQENPLANTVTYGVDHRHITLTGHLYGARGLYANAETMATLRPPLADAVRRAARDAIQFQRREAAAEEQRLRTALTRQGRQVVELTDQERERFRQAARDVVAGARQQVGEDFFQLFEQGRDMAELIEKGDR
jgi:TRAP-type C4-dicarboxylate transport system substrate-binding protein